MAGTKKNPKILTFEEEINILKDLNSGSSCMPVAEELGVGLTLTQSIRKQKHELTDDFENNAPLLTREEIFLLMRMLMN